MIDINAILEQSPYSLSREEKGCIDESGHSGINEVSCGTLRTIS